jgi:hypothetical protein
MLSTRDELELIAERAARIPGLAADRVTATDDQDDAADLARDVAGALQLIISSLKD